MRKSETNIIVPMIEPKDAGSAGITSDAINLGLVDACTLVINFGAITGNSILLVYASAARDLTTTAIAYSYRFGAADYKVALADQLGDVVAVAATGLTLTAATYDHRQLIVEIDPDTMPSGKPWLTFNIDATATVMLASAVAICTPRYAGHLNPSIL